MLRMDGETPSYGTNYLTPLGRECGNNWGYLTNPRTRKNASQAVYCTEYLYTQKPGKMMVLSPKYMGYNL